MLEVNNFIVFKDGADYSLSVHITEQNNQLAKNTTVTFSILDRDDDPIVGDITITSSSIPVGTTFASNVWTIGDIQNETKQGSFIITINSDTIDYAKIIATAATTSNETVLENNIGTYIYNGISFENLYKGLEEKTFVVPTSAFADNDNPTEAELITWVDANLSDADKLNGTILTYNPLNFVEGEVFQNFAVNFPTNGAANEFGSITINGSTFYSNPPGYDITDSASFDEVSAEAWIQAVIDAESGIAGTVTLTDEIDLNDRIIVSISNQTGISSFTANDYLAGNTYSPTSDESYMGNNGGRKTDLYVWVLNSFGSGYKITEQKKAETIDQIAYVSGGGNDVSAEIGDTHKTFATIDGAISFKNESSVTGGGTKILSGSHILDSTINVVAEDDSVFIVADEGTEIINNQDVANGLFVVQGDETVEDAASSLTFISKGLVKNNDVLTRAFLLSTKQGQISNFEFNKVEILGGKFIEHYGAELDLFIKNLVSLSTTSNTLDLIFSKSTDFVFRGNIEVERARYTADDGILINQTIINADSGSQIRTVVGDVYIDGADGVLLSQVSTSGYEGSIHTKIDTVVNDSTLATDTPGFYDASKAGGVFNIVSDNDLSGGVEIIEIGKIVSAEVPLVDLQSTISNGGTLHLKMEKGITGSYGINANVVLTGSTLIIDANIKCTGDKPAITLTGSADGTSKVIIRGRYEVTGTLPAICVGENYDGRVVVENSTLINGDVSESIIQTDAGAAIDVITLDVKTNSTTVDANINELGDTIQRSSNII